MTKMMMSVLYVLDAGHAIRWVNDHAYDHNLMLVPKSESFTSQRLPVEAKLSTER